MTQRPLLHLRSQLFHIFVSLLSSFFFAFSPLMAFVLSLDLLDNLGFLSSFQSHLILNLNSSHSFAFPLLYDLTHSKALEIWLPQSPLGTSHLPPSLNPCYQLPGFPLVLSWKQHQSRGLGEFVSKGHTRFPDRGPMGMSPVQFTLAPPPLLPYPIVFSCFSPEHERLTLA